MDVATAIESRRSIRNYERRNLPAELLEKVLDAARLAPSANNAQNWNIIVVTDRALLERLVPVSGNQRFVGACSAYLIGVSKPGDEMSVIDTTIALDHVTLRAVELGLGTCWIGDFDPEGVKRLLNIPEGYEASICLTLGYPADAPSSRKRKQLSELIMSDGWGKDWK
ncbi:MAG: nitroreductase family protein [Methanobacteriota archaeon]|nr:MAG: nitroreductase family protein [Euryarchaeota archaeon]